MRSRIFLSLADAFSLEAASKLLGQVNRMRASYSLSENTAQAGGAHSRFPGHALTPTGVMAIRCKQFHLPDL